MRSIKLIIRRLQTAGLGRIRNRKEIGRLRSCNVTELDAIAEACRTAQKKRFTKTESGWIGRIESMRKAMEKSKEEILLVDYGAGSPHLSLTPEAMYRGREVRGRLGEVCRVASKSRRWCFMLFALIRELKPSVCLEMGTALGISTSYIAAALQLNRQGRIVTIEGSEALAFEAFQRMKKLEIGNVGMIVGRFQDILEDVLKENAPIDFVFVDGHHDGDATESYFNKILPYLSGRAVLVFDDISWSEGMKKAWQRIAGDKRVIYSVDLISMGICVYSRLESEEKGSFQICI